MPKSQSNGLDQKQLLADILEALRAIYSIEKHIHKAGLWTDVEVSAPAVFRRAPLVPNGWALVPIELTEAMFRAWIANTDAASDLTPTEQAQRENFASDWRAVLAAIPKP